MEGYLSKHGFEMLRRKRWQSHPGGLIFELATCPFNADHTNGSAAFTLDDGVSGFTCKHNGCNDKTIKDIFAIFPAERSPGVELSDEWPDPAPLQPELPLVEALELEFVPESMRAVVRDVSERMQAPADF